MTPFVGELVGTMLLIIFGGGVVAGVVLKESKAAAGGWIVITFGWGLGVAMGIYAVGQFSGAHLNPAVTLALASIGEFPWRDVPGYVLAQMLGAIVGASVVWLHYAPHWQATSDSDAKRAVFCTDPAIDRPLANLISEIIGTFVLVLGILAIGANRFTDGLNPLIVGLLVLAIGLSLGGTTGYAINPARDLGPRIAHALLPIPGKGSNQWRYAWIPVVGPLIGGLAGAQFYSHVFIGGDTLLPGLAIGGLALWLAWTVIGARRQAAALERDGCD
ncbi:glycerol uptake facilitator protein [Halomonas cupida]|uniref:Glycerol uptake facilitator protein n=1 Tax=Halomonas cupida TaxID=44933 RepID=A0A1M7AMJ3_9GAMM|nr:MIP/aquaporin family protein [Halomonas cupida]GEN22335.1 glycerol uptake facilitator protein [Halomonas cupida]SHL43619.1 glycerol uptake facilitator protein [Halomonas cupida]